MKARYSLAMFGMLVMGIAAGYWAGVRDGARLAPVTNIKQIGLAFRHGHNDVAEPYPRPKQ